MKSQLITTIGLVSTLATLFIVIKASSEGKKIAEEQIEKKAVSLRSDKDQSVFEEESKFKAKADYILDHEKREITKKEQELKKSYNIEQKISEIKCDLEKHTREVEKELKYDETINTLREEPEILTDKFKESINYDDEVDRYQRRISDAEEEYKNKKRIYETFADEDSAKALKKDAKRAKKAIVNECTTAIEALKSRVSDYNAKCKSNSEKKITELNESLEQKISPFRTEAESKIRNAKADFKAHVEKARWSIINDRTNEDTDILDKYEFLKTEKAKIVSKEREWICDELTKITLADRIAYGLSGYSNAEVIFIGGVSILLVCYPLYRYLKFITEIFSKTLEFRKIVGE